TTSSCTASLERSESAKNRPNPPVSWRAMGRAIRIGQLGCGIVGSAVLRMLARNATDIEQRLGASIEVVAVAVRHLAKERDVPPGTEALYTTDPHEIVGHPDDLVRVGRGDRGDRASQAPAARSDQ